jgi:predicted DCC family thiol-disulfide oxidoreductase YuxK
MEQHGLNPTDAQSILLIKDCSAYIKSDAVLEIVAEIGPPWCFLRPLFIFPTAWRDALYDMIARNRYRWFGKRDVCYVPTAEERSRFLA